MPVFQVDLADGRAFEIESDAPPSEQDVLSALGHDAPAVGFDDRMGQQDGMLPESGSEKGLTELNAFSLPLALLGKLVAGAGNLVNDKILGYNPDANVARFDMNNSQQPLVVPQGERFVGGRTVFQDPSFAHPLREDVAINRGLNSLWEGITTPEGLATAGTGPLMRAPGVVGQAANVLTKGGGATFLLDMLGHAPESTKQAAGALGTYVGTPKKDRTPQMVDQTKDAVIQEAFNKLLLGLGAGHLRNTLRGPVDSTITPDVVDPAQRPVAGINRQLADGRGEVIDLEQSGGVYRAPGDVANQIEGPKRQFVTDEMGQTIPREQFDPMQGQDALAHRQPLQGYRPAPPVIETPEVGIHNTLKSIEARLNEFVQASKPAQKVVPAWQASGDAKGQGGQVSFEGQAAAGAVPSARQSAVDFPKTPALPDIRGGATEELMRMGNDAASLPAREKMISGEGQSSTLGGKAPQIEDGKYPVGDTSSVGPESELKKQLKGKVGKAVTFTSPDGFKALVSKDPAPGVYDTERSVPRSPWRVSYFSPTGEVLGHAEHPTWVSAVGNVGHEGSMSTISGKEWKVIPNEGELTNRGGSQASLPPAQQAISKANNSLEAFAKANGVEFVEGDTGPMILKKVQEKKQKSGSTVESVKAAPAPDKVEIQHILGNAAQLVKNAEYVGDITKEQSAEFQRRGDEAFANLDTNPELAREQAKKLREDVSPKNTDPQYGKRTDSRGNLYGGIPYLDPKFWKDNFGEKSYVRRDAKQLYNFIRNKLGAESAKWKALDTPEFQKMMLSGGTKSVDEVVPWVRKQEEGYRPQLLQKNDEWWKGIQKETETHTYGMEGKVSEAKKEYDIMTHEWYETLKHNDKSAVYNAMLEARRNGTDRNADYNSWVNQAVDAGVKRADVERYIKLDNSVRKELRSNLIFRNSDGTPKTDVSGMMFRIDNLSPEESAPTTKPSGGIGRGIQNAVEKNKEAGGIVNPFRKVNRPIKSSEFQDVQKFKPYADEVFDSTQPHGIGRIPGLSRLFDPRAYRTTPDGEAIIANAVASQKGQNFAALWQERQRDVQRVFETTDGAFKDANGRPGYMSDMIEAEMRNPGSQPLTVGQRNFIKEWKDLRKQIVDMATSEGVQFFVDEHGNVVPINENYFPRQAVGKVGIEETIRENVRKSVGGKQSFMKGRQYETEAEGVKAGIKYEPDEFNRIGRWMASVYKAIADTRLANDPLMQGRKQGRPKFLEEGQVFQPAFAGRIFPKDVAARLNRYYGEQPYNWLRSLSTINDNLKALQFTLDVSAPFNQGLPLMGVNPLRWAKATALSWKALLDDRTMTKYLKSPENAKAAKTILENNGSLVRLQDFLIGAGEGRGLHSVAPIRASGRSMGTFLTVAKIEMFKAFEPIADAKGWSKTELVEAVENAVLSGKMEMLGLSQGRAMGERLLTNAPSYIRGAVNLTTMAAQGKISGKVARRAIVGMAVAISATMYALYKSQGMTDEEIEKRFDPRNPNFYRYPHLMSNGQRVELSYGNIMISLARLAGTSADVVTGKKDYGPGTKGDPWLRWLSYRKSPVAGLALQMYTGEDYRGEPVGKMETLLRSVLPVSAEPLTDKSQASEGKVLGLPESKAIGVGAQLFGLNAFNESKGAFRQRKTEEISQRDYKTPFTNLGAVDRGFVTKEANKITDKTIDTKTTPRQVMNIVTDTEKRRDGLTKSLSKENQEWLKSNRLQVTSYQESMSINKREVKLADDDEKKMLQKFMSEETEVAVTTLRQNGGEPDQKRVNKRVELAHKRAWRRMRDELEASPK